MMLGCAQHPNHRLGKEMLIGDFAVLFRLMPGGFGHTCRQSSGRSPWGRAGAVEGLL